MRDGEPGDMAAAVRGGLLRDDWEDDPARTREELVEAVEQLSERAEGAWREGDREAADAAWERVDCIEGLLSDL